MQIREINLDTPVGAFGTMSTLSDSPEGALMLDIEHAPVEDDPRTWSNKRKNTASFIITAAATITGMSANIQNPATSEIQQKLHATAYQIGMSLSFFILVQGNFTFFWSAISEIKGRKLTYLVSVALFAIGSVIVAVSKTIGLVIGMRVVQAAGSSAMFSLGAATLADVFEPHERGSMMGVYYTGPLLGPAMGAILGGGLTQALGWRAIFVFLVILGGLVFLTFLLLFKDTFRKERSSTYQSILQRGVQERVAAREKDTVRGEQPAASGKTTSNGRTSGTSQGDVEAQLVFQPPTLELSIIDFNPFPPYLRILIRKNNVIILCASSLLFALAFSIVYTCARTLSLHYGYDAMMTGLVLQSYGIGTVLGSILGGLWSNRTLTRLKASNGGASYPEIRKHQARHVVVSAFCRWVFASSVCTSQRSVRILLVWIYASTLAYVVDANVGRSSSAVAVNSSFRGIFAYVAAQVAAELQDAIGDGGLYTLWAGVMFLAELMILLVLWNGKKWRETSIEAEKQKYGS